MKLGMERLGRDISVKKAQRMCLDKMRFQTKNRARDFASRGNARFERPNGPQKPYKCPLCGGYHLTSQKERPR